MLMTLLYAFVVKLLHTVKLQRAFTFCMVSGVAYVDTKLLLHKIFLQYLKFLLHNLVYLCFMQMANYLTLTDEQEMQLAAIANKIVTPGKGVLAADEINATMDKRFGGIGVENTAENRRVYR